MKKSIIALAVAASTFGVAQADTTLYGRVSYDYQYVKNQGAKSFSNINDQGTRIGIKGDNDLGNGLKAIYDVQFRMGGSTTKTVTVNTTANPPANLGTFNVTTPADQRDMVDSSVVSRRAVIGLTGDFGTALIGKFTLPYDDIATVSDDFNVLGHPTRFTAPSDINETIAYVSPNFEGFSFSAGVQADGNAVGSENHADAYQLTAQYDANGIFAGLGYVRSTAAAKSNWLTLGLGYENDMFKVAFNAERFDDNTNVNPVNYNLYGHYNFSDFDTVRLGFSHLDGDVTNGDSEGYVLGYQHNFSKRTRAWAEFSYTDPDGASNNSSALSLGLRTDF